MTILEKMNKKPVKIALISLFTALIIYISLFIFFQSHFYFGTVINGINASGKTAAEVDKELSSIAASYTLELDERGNAEEQIKGSEIGLKFNTEGGSQSLKEEQNKSSWFIALFNHKALNIENVFTCDENLLKGSFDKLSCVDSEKITQPKNASLVYSEGGYNIVKEVIGNKPDNNILYSSIKNAALNGNAKLNLESSKCYINPTITADSQKIKDTQSMLNKYITSKITYSYDDGSEVVDASEIRDWLVIDGDLNVAFNNAEMKSFVDSLASHYNTYGKVRSFATSLGTTISIGGGDYGWRVDTSEEISYLTNAIKNGQTAAREPQYLQKGASHSSNDIGNTYVEINLSKQHLWYYKNGALVVQGDVVTGNESEGLGTPTGIYRIKYKEKDATLKGQDYNSPVTYWMPFNNNIGIHDALWRTQFGGQIYLTKGSHGCINSPYSLAQTIFENISAGVPVVCYN
jgi:hypothetical protein